MTSLRGRERQEFPAAVKRAAFRRCCRNEIPYCEGCGIELVSGNIVFEHVDPDGLGGEPTLKNCKVYCLKACATPKTKIDNARMAKADAVVRKSYGMKPMAFQKIQSRGFAPVAPQRSASRPIQRQRG